MYNTTMHIVPITRGTLLADIREAHKSANPDGETITPFAQGFNSYAYQIGGLVVKVSKHTYEPEQIEEALGASQAHYQLLKRYLGEFVVDTSFHQATNLSDPHKLHLVSRQPFVNGIPVRSARLKKLIESGALYKEAFQAYLEAVLLMYAETKQIGDAAAIEGRFFDPFRTKNVILGSDGKPILTDVDRGKIQSSDTFGRAWSWLIANGVQRGRKRLLKST